MDLLASIRSSGGKGLKKAAERVIAKQKEEKPKEKKAMTMFEQLQESMNRRQAAISGKKDRIEKKRETIALMKNPDAFRQDIRKSMTEAELPIKAEVSAGSDDSDSDSDESNARDRVFSDDSYGAAGEPAAAPVAPPPAAAKKKVVVESPKIKRSPPRPQTSQDSSNSRRGSLWDESNKDLNRMLSSRAPSEDSEGSDSDWDE